MSTFSAVFLAALIFAILVVLIFLCLAVGHLRYRIERLEANIRPPHNVDQTP